MLEKKLAVKKSVVIEKKKSKDKDWLSLRTLCVPAGQGQRPWFSSHRLQTQGCGSSQSLGYEAAMEIPDRCRARLWARRLWTRLEGLWETRAGVLSWWSGYKSTLIDADCPHVSCGLPALVILLVLQGRSRGCAASGELDKTRAPRRPAAQSREVCSKKPSMTAAVLLKAEPCLLYKKKQSQTIKITFRAKKNVQVRI